MGKRSIEIASFQFGSSETPKTDRKMSVQRAIAGIQVGELAQYGATFLLRLNRAFRQARALVLIADQLEQFRCVTPPLRVCGIDFGQTPA